MTEKYPVRNIAGGSTTDSTDLPGQEREQNWVAPVSPWEDSQDWGN